MAPRKNKGQKKKKDVDESAEESSCLQQSGGTNTPAMPAPIGKQVIEDLIVDFFENNPCFYEKSNEDYKNRDKKNKLLEDFAKDLGEGYTRE